MTADVRLDSLLNEPQLQLIQISNKIGGCPQRHFCVGLVINYECFMDDIVSPLCRFLEPGPDQPHGLKFSA
jgi:hypothetical protein